LSVIIYFLYFIIKFSTVIRGNGPGGFEAVSLFPAHRPTDDNKRSWLGSKSTIAKPGARRYNSNSLFGNFKARSPIAETYFKVEQVLR